MYRPETQAEIKWKLNAINLKKKKTNPWIPINAKYAEILLHFFFTLMASMCEGGGQTEISR
jgi:hypothetical protein